MRILWNTLPSRLSIIVHFAWAWDDVAQVYNLCSQQVQEIYAHSILGVEKKRSILGLAPFDVSFGTRKISTSLGCRTVSPLPPTCPSPLASVSLLASTQNSAGAGASVPLVGCTPGSFVEPLEHA